MVNFLICVFYQNKKNFFTFPGDSTVQQVEIHCKYIKNAKVSPTNISVYWVGWREEERLHSLLQPVYETAYQKLLVPKRRSPGLNTFQET